jgi:hypothetical protein
VLDVDIDRDVEDEAATIAECDTTASTPLLNMAIRSFRDKQGLFKAGEFDDKDCKG